MSEMKSLTLNGKTYDSFVDKEARKAIEDLKVPEGGTVTDEQIASAVEDYFAENPVIPGATVEPAEDDIPKVFFGGPLQTSKTEVVVRFWYFSKTLNFDGYAEIKMQGNSSTLWPKKNQSVKLYKDAACTEKLKVNLKGWGGQNKFVIKANWTDLTHARNVVTARLWADVTRSRADYNQMPELLRTSPNQGAVDGFPVKVWADGVYQGRYSWNIPKDKWMFNMDDELDEHVVLCGEGYGTALFRGVAKVDGSSGDWTDEIHKTVPASVKTRWNEIINFVETSTDAEFKANLGQYFNVPSLIDYHLTGLASCGYDAYGKNQIYFTYDGQIYYADMYDMDGTWGVNWTGGFIASDYGRDKYEDMLSDRGGNLLYMRLEKLFWPELQARWPELKAGPLSIPNIVSRMERFTDIAPPELVAEDYAETTAGGAFTNMPGKGTNNIQQIRKFALERQAWTDAYLAGLVVVECTGITLDKSAITISEKDGTVTLTATTEPVTTTEPVIWTSDATDIATVKDGVVTAKANGTANITATCGNYSATCVVTVAYQNIACTSITLSASELAFVAGDSVTKVLTATVEPSDTTETIVWNSNAPDIATVENGVVTAKANGNAVITATCGNQSATCAVSVSGIGVVDYTKDALDGVSFVQGREYDKNTGNVVSNSEASTTDKIDLQACRYKFTVDGFTDINVFAWDADGNYCGKLGKCRDFVALSGYKYAFSVFKTTAESDLSSASVMPYYVEDAPAVTIKLSEMTWVNKNGSAEAALGDYAANIPSKVNTANVIIGLNNGIAPSVTKIVPMFALWSTTLIWCGMTAEEAAASDLVLRFNE